MPTSPNLNTTEVIIIGGSYSGMAAAMTLGRALREVTLLDAGEPCNRFAPQAHNFLTGDGVPPMEILANARKQLLNYPSVRLVGDRVTDASRYGGVFIVHTASGKSYTANKLLLATGLKDVLPDIPGLKDCWGKSVIHCPYCHGYEFRGRKTGILAAGADTLHLISLIKQWSSDVEVFTYGGFGFNKTARTFMEAQNISLNPGNILSVDHANGQIKHVLLEAPGGRKTQIPLSVLYVAPPVQQSLDLRRQLGYQLTPTGHIQVDETGHTSVSGLYAAGDNSSRLRSLSTALASGMTAGAVINFDLVHEKRPLPVTQ